MRHAVGTERLTAENGCGPAEQLELDAGAAPFPTPRQVAAIEAVPLGAIARTPNAPTVLKTQLTSRILAEESNVRLAPIVVHVWLTAEIPVDRHLINFGPEHSPDRA